MTPETITQANVTYLSHHALLLAVPALLPAVIVSAVVIYLAVRDRRSGDDETPVSSDS
jgi:hypothetical protein